MGQVILPSIEKRTATWLEVNRKLRLGKDVEKKYSITISREYGCNAYPLSLELKRLLDKEDNEWSIFDKQLVQKASENSNFTERLLEQVGESSRYMDAFVSTFKPNWQKDIDGYKVLWKQILGAAKQGNAIIVGRGSSFITQELDNCFQFHLTASKSFRIDTVAARHGITKLEAEEEVEKNESLRHQFLKKFLQQESFNPINYHIVFNNEHLDYKLIAKMILTYLHEKTGSEAFKN